MDQEIKNEFGKMGGEIGGLKSEIGGMKGEIGGLKSEIGGMKGEIGGLKGEMSKMSSEFEKLVIMIKKGFDKTATKQELKVCKKELRAEINKKLTNTNSDLLENKSKHTLNKEEVIQKVLDKNPNLSYDSKTEEFTNTEKNGNINKFPAKDLISNDADVNIDEINND